MIRGLLIMTALVAGLLYQLNNTQDSDFLEKLTEAAIVLSGLEDKADRAEALPCPLPQPVERCLGASLLLSSQVLLNRRNTKPIGLEETLQVLARIHQALGANRPLRIDQYRVRKLRHFELKPERL